MEKHKRRALPDPAEYPVIPPDMNYIYFDGYNDFPFEPSAEGYSAVDAWHLSDVSFLAYTHPGFARMAFKLAGYSGFRFFGGKTTECFAAWKDDYAVVAFRGTELKSLTAVSEILTDLNAGMTDFSAGGRVHRGFLAALNEIWEGKDGLHRFIGSLISEKPSRPIFLTGHSLGGALASLAFALTGEAAALYTFGTPRTGNGTFAELLNGRQVFRHVNAGDPITDVPPETGSGADSFRHAGKAVYLDEEGYAAFTRKGFNPAAKKDEAGKQLGRHARKTLEMAVSSAVNILRKDAVPDWKRHFGETVSEWNDYLKSLDRVTGLRLDKHAPLYYSLKLWNVLAG